MSKLSTISPKKINKSRFIILSIFEKQGFDVDYYKHFKDNEIEMLYNNKQLDMLLEKKTIPNTKTKLKSNDNENEEKKELDVDIKSEELEVDEEEEEKKENEKIYIMYCIDKKLTVSDIEMWIDDLFHDTNTLSIHDTLFIITKDDINETLTKFLIHAWERDHIFIVTESISRLQFNILESVHVPSHSILSEKITMEVCKKHNCKTTSDLLFPTLSRFDPVAKLIRIKPNELCYIIRPSKTSILSFYYRVCVNKPRY